MLDAHVLQAAAAVEPNGLLAADWCGLACLIRELNCGDGTYDTLWAAFREAWTQI